MPGLYTYKVTAKELNDSNGMYVCTYRTISSSWTEWQRVLLNGDIIDNCRESYSTDEQLTGGTWIDGKPIYRIYVTFPLVHLQPSEWNIINLLSITGIDEIINARAKRSEDNSIIPLAARSSGTSIEVNPSTNFGISKLILEYTKK